MTIGILHEGKIFVLKEVDSIAGLCDVCALNGDNTPQDGLCGQQYPACTNVNDGRAYYVEKEVSNEE